MRSSDHFMYSAPRHMWRGSHWGVSIPLVGLLASAPAALAGETVSAEAETTRPAEYEPMLSFKLGKKVQLEVPIEAGIRTEAVADVPVDPDGRQVGTAQIDGQFRLGLSLDTRDAVLPFLLFAELEADLFTGTIAGRNDGEGVGLPGSDEAAIALRKAYLRASLMQYLHLIGGAMTSHWGMGLLANDGAGGSAPGIAQFDDPRDGDRVVRAMLATGPHTKRHKIFAAVGVDLPVLPPSAAFDDFGTILPPDDVSFEGDDALQVVAALVYGRDQPSTAGIYYVRRHHEAEDGSTIDVNVLDAAGQLTLDLEDDLQLKLEGEVAFVFGETTLAPSPDFPTHDVMQLGASVRATLDGGIAGGVIDFLYATGDGDLDDNEQSGFKVDRNYSMGLLLYRHVLAAQTGNAPVRASNLDIVGVPPEDVERFATRGSASGTIAVFPKFFVRPVDGLEVYGGPLFAWSSASLLDPFNTKLAGGSPRNALDATPGAYLGTELDLGVRYRLVAADTELTIGVEGGVLLPGDAFLAATGEIMDNVFGGRALLRYRL